ncbi:MAG TPA: GNAT family N-acetyltransferase, partial [Thermomicrobiales bacterium]
MTGETTTSAVPIRPARAEEADALSALALRAKAHWGYDAAFIAAYRDELAVTAEAITTGTIRVATHEDQPCGFYELYVSGETATLDDLWIDPGTIGKGVGRALWQHAVATAKEHGCRELHVESDPHAEGFYRKMGAERIGIHRSTVIPGRELPVLRLA